MTEHYLVGEVPVRVERQDGRTRIEFFNRRTGRFEVNARYYSAIHRDDTGLVRQVDRDAFDQAVRHLRDLQVA